MGLNQRQLHSTPASVGIAGRAPVITPVPAFGSSVYRILEIVKEPGVTDDGNGTDGASLAVSPVQRQLVVTTACMHLQQKNGVTVSYNSSESGNCRITSAAGLEDH